MPKRSAQPISVRAALDAVTPLRREFIKWMVSGSPRPRGAQKQWALDHGLNPETLKWWKREPKFRRAWDAVVMERSLDPEEVGGLIRWCYQRVVEHDDRNLAVQLLAFLRRWTPAPEVQIRHNGGLALLSDGELQTLLERELEQEVDEEAEREPLEQAGPGHGPDAAAPPEGRFGDDEGRPVEEEVAP